MGRRYIPQHLGREVKKKRVSATVAVPAVCLLLLVFLAGAVIGRYQRELGSGGSVRAKEFYFTSDLLDGDTHTLAPGSTEVTFTLRNHEDELRCSEVDITYAVTVARTAGAAAGDAEVKYGNGGQKLTKGSAKGDTVTIANLFPGTYTVTATGTGGYEKTLTATIEVLGAESAVYKHLDTSNSEYVLLTVWAQGYQGSVTIEPPEGLIPDNTDQMMKTAETSQSFTDAVSFGTDGYASHTYRFFGSGVTVGDFEVTYNGGTAEEKEPG